MYELHLLYFMSGKVTNFAHLKQVLLLLFIIQYLNYLIFLLFFLKKYNNIIHFIDQNYIFAARNLKIIIQIYPQ